MESVFLRKLEEYDRNTDVVQGYFEQAALYLKLHRNLTDEQIAAYFKNRFGKGGKFEFNPPMVRINVRDPETGDRHETKVRFDKLLDTIRTKNLVFSASMAAFLPAKYKRSLLAIFIDENIKARGRIKDEMFAAEQAGNEALAINKDNEQTSKKTRNNALSGAHSSEFTILCNKSTHSVLTSTCRCATSYGNANNEKMIGGNRHYYNPGIVLNNILSTCTITDFSEFNQCMETYKLYVPTVDDVMEMIAESATWRNVPAMKKLRETVEKLSDMQRAAFMYIGDLFHIRKFNKEVVDNFIFRLATRVDTIIDDPIELIKIDSMINGDTSAFIAQLYPDVMKSRKFNKVKEESPEEYKILLSAAGNVFAVLNEYKLFVRALFTTKNVPAAIARLPEIERKVGLVSDTDSTMCTAQWWSKELTGEYTGPKADAIADAVIYIAVQNIAHMMARMSANLGVEDAFIFRYAMKNEFKFASFLLTGNAKHYGALVTLREGMMYKKPELELKGVNWRSSNIPPEIMNQFKHTFEQILIDIKEGRKIKLFDILREVSVTERAVVERMDKGDYDLLKTNQIKIKDAYSTPDSSNYIYYELWEEVFAPKYGSTGEPPFGVVKVNVDVPNKTSLVKWINSIADEALAKRLDAWLKKKGRDDFTQILIPEIMLSTVGIPEEIGLIVDRRRLMFSSVEPYYHLLEELGVRLIDKNRTRLVSDYY